MKTYTQYVRWFVYAWAVAFILLASFVGGFHWDLAPLFLWGSFMVALVWMLWLTAPLNQRTERYGSD